MIYGLIIADLLMVAAVTLTFNQLPPQIPLFYSRPWGEDQIIDIWFIVILPIIMHLFYFINSWIAKKFFSESEFLVKVLRITNWFLIIVLTAIFIRIIFLVT